MTDSNILKYNKHSKMINSLKYARNPRKNDVVVDCLLHQRFRVSNPYYQKSDEIVVEGHLLLKTARKQEPKESAEVIKFALENYSLWDIINLN